MPRTRIPKAVLDYFKRKGHQGGKIGGKKRMAAMTPEERSELARKGAAARWAKPDEGGGNVSK